MSGITLRTDTSDLAKEKAAYLLSVESGHNYQSEHIREMVVEGGGATMAVHVSDGRVYRFTGFSAFWLRYAVRSESGWSINENPHR